MAQDIPVYLFTGFMDSGKTTLVEETLFENNFGDGSKGIIIMCEDGEKEYDEAKLATINFKLVTVEEEEDFTPAGHLSAGTNFYRVQRHLGDGQAA